MKPEYKMRAQEHLEAIAKRAKVIAEMLKGERPANQAEMMYDDLTILNEDISELQMIVKELRQQKKLAEIESY